MKTTERKTYTPISELSGDTIDTKPRNVTWDTNGYGATWDYYECSACEKCGALLVGTNGESHSGIDLKSECDGYVPQNEGPMMNYFYPLPGDRTFRGLSAIEAAKLIANLPLCIVNLGIGPDSEDDWGLALTGGGMDLTWEIAEAYMRLGYMPPLHFCDLPGMCGRGNLGNNGKPGKVSARDAWIISACKKSAQVAIQRARWTLHKLNSLKAQKA